MTPCFTAASRRPTPRRSNAQPKPRVSSLACPGLLPAPPLPPRLRRARELAGHLIELGDAADSEGPVYYRAARFLDRNEVDIDAAARESNLGVLPWLEEPARVAVEEWLATNRGS